MRYRPGYERAGQKFPISDYIRLGIMALVILLTLVAIKIGGFLTDAGEEAPAIEGPHKAGKGYSFTRETGEAEA
jgi:hypothetical protein